MQLIIWFKRLPSADGLINLQVADLDALAGQCPKHHSALCLEGTLVHGSVVLAG